MRIAIDCRPLTRLPTGVANFVIPAINEWSSLYPDSKFYLLINCPLHEEVKKRLSMRSNVIVINSPLFIFKNIGILWYHLKLWYILRKLNPNYFWAPTPLLPIWIPRSIKTIVTVHDFVYKEFKFTANKINRIVNFLFSDRSIKKADILWSISMYTKRKIEFYFPKRKCRSIFVGCAIDKKKFICLRMKKEEQEQLLRKYNVPEKLLMFVGTLEPRKNLIFLLSLMPILVKYGYGLLVVGAKGWGRTGVKDILENNNILKDNISFAGYVNTDELVKLYNVARIFVSTSLNEGFGFPQLEAMACGCPAVTAHNSAMIEVVEGAGMTVEGWEKEKWCEAINEVYRNRIEHVEKGFEKIKCYDWNNIIKELNEYLMKYKQSN